MQACFSLVGGGGPWMVGFLPRPLLTALAAVLLLAPVPGTRSCPWLVTVRSPLEAWGREPSAVVGLSNKAERVLRLISASKEDPGHLTLWSLLQGCRPGTYL